MFACGQCSDSFWILLCAGRYQWWVSEGMTARCEKCGFEESATEAIVRVIRL